MVNILQSARLSASTNQFSYYNEFSRTNSEHMPEEVMDYVRVFSKRSPMSFGYWNQLKPYALNSIISLYEVEKIGLTINHGVEQYLIRQKPQNTEIISLEDRESYELLFDLPNDYFAYTLTNLFEGIENEVNKAVKGYAGYRLGDETMLQGIERDVELVRWG